MLGGKGGGAVSLLGRWTLTALDQNVMLWLFQLFSLKHRGCTQQALGK